MTDKEKERIDTLIGVAAKYKIDRPDEYVRSCCMGDCKLAWWALLMFGAGVVFLVIEFCTH
jgi:hypothetical protein